MKNKILKILVIMLAISMILAGCGNKKNTSIVDEITETIETTETIKNTKESSETLESNTENKEETTTEDVSEAMEIEKTEFEENKSVVEVHASTITNKLNLDQETSAELLEELQMIAELSNGNEDEYNAMLEELVMDYAQEGKTIDIEELTNIDNNANSTGVKDSSSGDKFLEQEKANMLAAANGNAGNNSSSTTNGTTTSTIQSGNSNTNTGSSSGAASTGNTSSSSSTTASTNSGTTNSGSTASTTTPEQSTQVPTTPTPTPEPTPEPTPVPEVHTCAFAWETSGDTRTMKCSCGATGITEYCYNGLWGYYDDAEANDLWDRVNNSRSNSKYQKLDEWGNFVSYETVPSLSRTLDATAKQRAVEVAVNYSHDGCTTANECLAQGQGSALYAHDGWLNSQTHHHAMISPSYTTGGVACFWYDSNNSGENLTPIWVLSLNE